ncbi:MAG: efflux RND transporter permease subunit [Bacteroides sp.]|nr:efflux RND transporter permease subunit [Bacteroides sp.]MCM1379628.1 efflux RND transporter permease subunit [Bacteroides sp.]MCM1445990.1 efflux RND transporter permease subunit [Prevotella sp.]
MLNRIIHSSLANRVIVLIVSAVILCAGIWSLTRTEVDIFPDLTAPTVVVMTEAPGLAPEEVEREVSYPIEAAVNGATGIRRVRSTSSPGFSVVWVEFDWDTDVYLARQMVSERLASVAEDMPAGVNAPILGPQASILGEMMIIGLTAPGDSVSQMELRTIADKLIRPRLLSLSGVSSVSVIGGDARELQILLDPARMKAYGVNLNEILSATESMNDNASGGVIYDFGNEYLVRADLNTSNAAEIAAAPIGGGLTLGHVARVKDGAALPRIGTASVNGSTAVIITVTKQPGVGTIGLTERIDSELESLKPTLPAGVQVKTDIFRQADFIQTGISNLQRALLEGGLFVAIVLFLFLMNLRTTLISLVAMPMSIFVTLLILHFCGFTINTMSLGGIAIAIGSLVDDAIVDVENVYKRLRQNRLLPADERRPIKEVVYHASAEVRTPIFNSSLVIIASFLPLFFLSGVEGRLLIPLGVAFIVSLIASTIVALTLTPVLCSYLPDSKEVNKEPWAARKLRAAYDRSLRAALRRPRLILGGVGVIFIAALGVFFTLGGGFLPRFNEGSFTINVATLPGVSLEESDRIGREAERLIMESPEVRCTARKTGRAELDEHSLNVNVSEIEVPYTLSGRSRSELEDEIRSKLTSMPGVNVEIGQPISHRIDAMLSGTESHIAIKLFGPELPELYRLATQIKKAAEGVEGIVDLNVEQQVERPELQIRPKRAEMARLGLSLADFREFISAALGGRKVSRVYDSDFPYDLTVILAPEARESIASLRQLSVLTPIGAVPLEQIAEVVSTTGPNVINRENVKRRIVISANVADRDLASAVKEIQSRVAGQVQLPENYYLQYGGQFENSASASRTLRLATIGAILLIVMLLYSEFHSKAQAAMILVNMPLALIGGIFMLALCGGEVNIPAIIGFISLMGISTRNGMLLMSRYNALRTEGVSVAERVRTGSVDRLLPIVMTALTSALALLPLAVNGQAPGNEIQSPMALVILGGLISSTILNLYVLPILYLKNYSK